MPDRSSLGQLTQIAVETTEGVLVPATKILKSIDFTLNPHGETFNYRPVGSKYFTTVAPAREWSVTPITGAPVYDEIGYLLAGVIGTSTDTVVLTTGQQHVHTLSPTLADTIKTYSIEDGGSIRAATAAGLMITDFGFTFSRTAVGVTGNGMAQRITDGATLTGSLSSNPQIPILPTQIDVYIDSARGSLGTTKMLRVFAGTITLGTRFGAVWPLNSTLTSYASHIESVPAATLSLTMEADAAGMAYLTNYRAGSTVYVRVKATGPVITGGTAVYALQFDMACKVSAVNAFSDSGGVYAITWPFDLVDDGTSPLIATLTNATATL